MNAINNEYDHSGVGFSIFKGTICWHKTKINFGFSYLYFDKTFSSGNIFFKADIPIQF